MDAKIIILPVRPVQELDYLRELAISLRREISHLQLKNKQLLAEATRLNHLEQFLYSISLQVNKQGPRKL